MKRRKVIAILSMLSLVVSLAGCSINIKEASTAARNESPASVCEETSATEDNGVSTSTVIEPANYYDSKEVYLNSDEAEETYIAYDVDSVADGAMGYEINYSDIAVSYQAERDYEEGCEMPGINDKADVPTEKYNTEEYSAIEENGFSSVSLSPLSTFSADVDTASYANLRRMINMGYGISRIPAGAVRIEEMINYFDYSYARPRKGEPFSVNAEISTCPWNEEHLLMMLGLQTEMIDFTDTPDSNLVFLIDVSGSMYDDNKLPLLKRAFAMLIDNLSEKDRVSIVTYAGRDQVLLKGVPATDKETILSALDSLEAGGSTNGGQGIITAYELAERYFIEDGNNRILLATDGDFNVGITSQSDLYNLIDDEKDKGVFLSVLGFGMGNYSDTNMETLADHGNGNYAYIDDIKEARKVLVDELGATMFTVAKDVKFQVEFNPAQVKEYRLIGYENRAMAAEDFDNDKKDAGEIGAGHSVTVLYELVLEEDESESHDSPKGLKYQDTNLNSRATNSNELLTVSLRYKEPNEDESKLLEYPIGYEAFNRIASDDFNFASAVAEFGMILKDSKYLADGNLEHVLNVVDSIETDDEYKQEFADLVWEFQYNY